MPVPETSITWYGAVTWLLAIILAGFLVTWVLTNLLGMRRTPYILCLALVTGGLTWGYLYWSGTSVSDFITNHWGWGLVGAAVTGTILTAMMLAQPGNPRPKGVHLAGVLAWEGVVYGTAEGLLLSTLPVLVTWQAFWAVGWTDGTGKVLVAGSVSMVASLAMIVIHHMGYRGFLDPAILATVAIGCGILSLAYLLTGSPLAPVGGHIVMHMAANVHGVELVPYPTGVVPITPIGRRRQAKTLPRAA